MKWWVGIAAFICSVSLYAQTGQNQRVRDILIQSDSVLIDTSVIFIGSVSVSNGMKTLAEGTDYRIDYKRSLFFPINIPQNSLVRIQYKVMAFNVGKSYAHKDHSMLHQEYKDIKNPFLYSPNEQKEELFNKEGLKMNGSLSRGLAFGNNQDIVLNSNLNLQLAGKLNNDIDVLAAISDQNNPVQPEGNTQQLQDFDKVFIQLSKNRTKLVVGDFEMNRPNQSYFMNYYKKSRGGQLYSAANVGKRGELRFGGEGAISRGRFVRNVINGIEGNQGPYRLTGSNGETYIVIISGTESVYLDGERLKRGEQNDYVIDYNSGEITFMPKRVITQYSRVIVEFQYSDKNYSRSVFHFNTEYEEKNFRIRANYFTEQDNKNQPFLQNLTDSNKLILASAGDNTSAALAPSESKTNTFSANKILYRKIDTAGFTGVYVYTSDPLSDTVFYELKFTYMGENKGNYILAQTAANGRVFRWVAPVGGVKQGNYEPVTQLISPKRMQMFTIGTDLMMIRNTKVSMELAHSNYDKNLFSDLDKGNDNGNGVKVGVENTIPLEDKPENGWNIKTQASYEYVDKNFRYVERYRNVEFDRTWNRLLTNQPTQDTGYEENIASLRTSLNKSSIGNLFYQVGYYNRAGQFNGLQSLAGTALRYKKNILNGEAEWINTKDRSQALVSTNETRRYKLDYGREVFFLIAGIKYETEQSSFRQENDSLLKGSYAYDQYTFYVNNKDSSRLKYHLEYSQREDYQPRNTEFSSATTGKNFNANTEYTQKNLNRLTLNFTYREFEVRDTSFTKLQPERTILTRIEYDYGFIQKIFTANTYYQLGSGNELRQDYQYVEVPVGQGQYVWKDFNDDGKQTLNEFVLASFADKTQANFIKVFLPTNSTIRTNSNQFNQTLNINPAIVWGNKQGFKRFIGRWYNQTALKIDRKTTDLKTLDFVNPFMLNMNDSVIISNSSLIRNSLFFNRSDPTFGFDLNYLDNRSKNFQTNGFDTRSKQEQGANLRWNFTTVWGITVGFNNGVRSYYSDYFSENNYLYTFNEIKPKLIWQATRNFRATMVFSYFEGLTGETYGNKKGTNREVGGELRYSVAKSGVLNARFSVYQVNFNGDISSPLGYDMLQGFVIGKNMLWNLNYQQRLGSNVQININYDGRKSEGQNIIHIGRVEARYLF